MKKKFFGPFRVSVMLDSNGSNTTAAAGVALLAKAKKLKGKKAVVLAGTGPVGMRAAAMLGTGGRRRHHHLAHAEEGRRGGQGDRGEVRGQGEGDRGRRRCDARRLRSKDANIVYAAGAIGLQLLPLSAWKDNPNIEMVADVNAQPPLGIEGIEATDKGKDRFGKLAFGALGIGGLKLKLHRACIGQLFESSEKRVRRRGDLRARQGDGLTPMIKQSAIEKFLDDLASQNATPGGGSAAAIIGAMGAALVAMVCNLTIGKKKYADVEDEMRALLAKAEALRHKLTGMIEDDVKAFDAVMGAYGMPKETDAEKERRSAAIQDALKLATDVPMRCCHAAREVIDLAAVASAKGNLGVISDAGVAVLAAYAALRSAALNVYTNAKIITDKAYADAKLKELETLLAGAEGATEELI